MSSDSVLFLITLKTLLPKKNYDFNQSILEEDEMYELKDPLIRRHFIFSSFEELTKKLKKGKKDYIVDFNDDTHYYFGDQTYEYFKQHECILNNNFIDPFDLRLLKGSLDSIIKKHTSDKELKTKHLFNKKCKSKIYEITVQCYGINKKLKHIIIF